jgi:hypothetical protein
MLVTDKIGNVCPILAEFPGVIERTSVALGLFHDEQHTRPYIFYDKDTASGVNVNDIRDFFEPCPAVVPSSEHANVGLVRRELILAQKIGIMVDNLDCQRRDKAGKLERDKEDARELCKSLGIKGADDLDATMKYVFAHVDIRAAARLPNFPKALTSKIASGQDVKDAWHVIDGDSILAAVP